MACTMDMYDMAPAFYMAPAFLRGPSELFDNAPALLHGTCDFAPACSRNIFDMALAPAFSSGTSEVFSRPDNWLLDRILVNDTQNDYNDYLTDISSGLESWSSTDTEETSAKASFMEDFGSPASSCDSPAMAIGMHQDTPALCAWSSWSVHHPMGAEAYMRAAHRAPHQNANVNHYEQFSNETPIENMPAGSKRLHPGECLHHDIACEALAPRLKSARILSKRIQSQNDALHIEASGVALAAAEAVLPLPAPVALAAALVSDRGNFPFRPSVKSDSQLPSKKTILQCCKFTSKQTQQACKGELTIVPHKREHLAVSCSSRHQWVWCSMCCNCHSDGRGNGGRQRGCTVPTHWFERDAFDTGARNHMNVHKAGMNK